MMHLKHYFAAAAAVSVLLTGCGADSPADAPELIADAVSEGYIIVPGNKDYAPMYAEPSENSERITELPNRKAVTVYTEKNGWYYVLSAGEWGYVQEQFVAFGLTGIVHEAEEESEAETTTVTTETTAPETETETTTVTTEAEEEETQTEEPATEPPKTEAPAPVTAKPSTTRYTIFISETDLLNAAGLSYVLYPDEFFDFCTISDLKTSSGTATVAYENFEGNDSVFQAMRGVRVTDATEGTLTVTGKMMRHSWKWADEEHTKRNVYDDTEKSFTYTMTLS